VALDLITSITLRSAKSSESGDRTATDTFSATSRTQWTDGSGAGAASKEYGVAQTTLGTVSDTYDLSGALTNAIGEAVVFTKITAAYFSTPSTNAGTINVGGGANPWNKLIVGTLALPPGASALMQSTSGTVWTVTASTGDILTVAGTSGDKYQFYLAGE
jgi:hypothetical protein